MIYKHPTQKGVTWEDGKRGRPPAWVVALRSGGAPKEKSKAVRKKKEVVNDTPCGDPVSRSRQVLSDGSYRVNGRVIYVGPDCEFVTCPGDTISKIN